MADQSAIHPLIVDGVVGGSSRSFVSHVSLIFLMHRSFVSYDCGGRGRWIVMGGPRAEGTHRSKGVFVAIGSTTSASKMLPGVRSPAHGRWRR